MHTHGKNYFEEKRTVEDCEREIRSLTARVAELEAALRSAAVSFEQLVALKRIPENMAGLRDVRAALAKLKE